MLNISFVIPCHNKQGVLERCIHSIRKETNRYLDLHYEIIVVDNASNDWTAEIARNHRTKVIYEPKDDLAYARMVGFQAARYDIVANINPNNVIPSFWLQKSMENFDNDTNLVFGPNLPPKKSRFLRLFWHIFYYFFHFRKKFLQSDNFILKKSAITNFTDEDNPVKAKYVPQMWVISLN